jgi:phosphohistidine phosphatase
MRLWLLRHAKSSWDTDGLDDHDRPLSPRGVHAAERMAIFLAREPQLPTVILCSTAVRARQTLDLVLPALNDPDVVLEPRLYTFDAEPVIDRLREVSDEVSSVMVVGHNPAIHEVALTLTDRGDRLDALAQKYPTGALAAIDLPGDRWTDIGDATGVLSRFVTPRELRSR